MEASLSERPRRPARLFEDISVIRASASLGDGMAQVVTPPGVGVHKVPPSEQMSRFGDTLGRIALTVNSSLDIKEILHRLASLTLEAIPADYCTLFLLDESGNFLHPAVSLGQRSDALLWQEIKKTAPFDLREDPARWRALRVERALGITDISSFPLIPARIAQLLRDRSMIMVPLTAAGEPLGLLVLDWAFIGREASPEELSFVEAIGAYAALAIRNARLYEKLAGKARSLERLVRVGATLNSSTSLRSVLDLICAGFEELLGTNHCSVNLLDESSEMGVRTLVVRGVSWFTRNPESIAAVPRREIERVENLWRRNPDPVVYPDLHGRGGVDPLFIPAAIRSAALFPLVRPGALLGFVMTGLPVSGPPSQEDLGTGQALADQAATAIWRASLHESLRHRVQRLEVLYRLSDVVAGTADLTAVLRQLNRVLRPELGIRIESIVVANPQIRESVGAATPSDEQMEAIRSWRGVVARGGDLGPRQTRSGLLIPMVHHNRVQGAVQFSLDALSSDASDEDLLAAVASGCAEVIYKAELRKNLESSERRLAIASERERIARDLHDSVGQVLTGIGMRLAALAPEAPDRAWQDRLSELLKLAERGSREIRQAIYSLLFLQVRGKGLVRSLRSLTRKFEATTGIVTSFKTQGEPLPIATTKEDALFRVAHEGLMNIERHSRASAASVILEYSEDATTLSVRDDGVGLENRDPFGRLDGHFGLRGLQQLVEECGGSLEIRNAQPRGLFLQVRVPAKSVARQGSIRRQADVTNSRDRG